MLSNLVSALSPAVLARALLLANHVIAGEPVATTRLRPHAGRSLRLLWRGEAGLLPLPPAVALRVTPAGLFELDEAAPAAAEAADLTVTVDLPPPHRLLVQWLAGERPPVAIDGDAQFAADVAWLGENLHWDIEHDLAGVVGDAPAHELLRFGRSLRDGLRRAGQGLQDSWRRRPGAGSGAASR